MKFTIIVCLFFVVSLISASPEEKLKKANAKAETITFPEAKAEIKDVLRKAYGKSGPNTLLPATTTPSSQTSICSEAKYNKDLVGGGCYRTVHGFDITGVSNTVDLFDTAVNPCDCMLACKLASSKCANWVWKFTAPNQKSKQCNLYSNFNLPTAVTISVNITGSINVGLVSGNPQAGGLAPHCTMDNTATGVNDPQCVSGGLFALDNNMFMC